MWFLNKWNFQPLQFFLKVYVRGGSFENNVSEPEIKIATCSLSHPVHISEEVLVPSCFRKIRAGLKVLKFSAFEIPAACIFYLDEAFFGQISSFIRSAMTWQVFCSKFPNKNLAQLLARWTHNPKVHSSILGREFFQNFFATFCPQFNLFTSR